MLGYIISAKCVIDVKKHKIISFDVLCKTHYLNIFVVENNIIYYASKFGHVQVLEWFKNSGYKFEYNNITMNKASLNRQIQILEWFKNSGYKLKYDYYVIENIKFVSILKFFIKNINI